MSPRPGCATRKMMDGLRKVRKDSEEWRELGGVFRALTILKVGARLACLCRELRGISMAPVLIFVIFCGRAWGVELSDAEVQNHRCLTCHAQSHIGEIGPAE